MFKRFLKIIAVVYNSQLARSDSLWDVVHKSWNPRLRACVTFCYYPSLTHYSPVLLFYNPWKHQKIFRFSDVFRGYRKTTPGCNGLRCLVGVKANMTWTTKNNFLSLFSQKNLKPVLFWNIKGQWNTWDGKYIICGFKF